MFIKLFVNDACNIKGQVDIIDAQEPDGQMTSSELSRVLANPLFINVKSVEINGGEPTLHQNLADIINALFKKLPQLLNISLVTNALNSDQVIERIVEIGQVVKSHSGRLDVVVSLTDLGNVNDEAPIRPGNFENIVKVIDYIQSSNLVSRSRLRCSVNKDNLYRLHDLLEFALNKKIYIYYRLENSDPQLCSNNVNIPQNLTFEERYHIVLFLESLIRFYEESELQNSFYRALVAQLIDSISYPTTCDWQNQGVIIFANGELLHSNDEIQMLGSVYTECDAWLCDLNAIPSNKILLGSRIKGGLKNSGVLPRSLKELKVLRPLRLLKQQLDYRGVLLKAGVDLSTISITSMSKPSFRFPSDTAGKRKVMICGWYGTETLGDKAILGGVVNSIRAALGDFELYLVSLQPYVTQMTILQMPELHGCHLLSEVEGVNLASSMDLVAFGGGPLMIQIPQLADMLAIFQKAVAAEVPTLIAGCGVGPLGLPHHDEAIKSILLHASHRIYRDRKSMLLAQSLGVDTTKDRVAEDPAFTWLKDNASTSNDCPTSQGGFSDRPKLLLGLRDWPYSEFAEKMGTARAEQLKLKFENEVITALDLLIDKYPDLKIIPFPMCTNHFGRDDRWFYREFFRNHSNLQNALDLSYLGAELSPLESINIFRSASAALTMRFHSLVFSLSNGIPALAIDYTLGGKVRSLAEKYGVPFMGLDSVNREFIFSSLLTLLTTGSNESISHFKAENLTFKSEVSSFISSLQHNS